MGSTSNGAPPEAPAKRFSRVSATSRQDSRDLGYGFLHLPDRHAGHLHGVGSVLVVAAECVRRPMQDGDLLLSRLAFAAPHSPDGAGDIQGARVGSPDGVFWEED